MPQIRTHCRRLVSLRPSRLGWLALLGVILSLETRGAPAPVVAVGQIAIDERSWGRGRLPTLTFTLTGGRGAIEKVAAFLYTAEVPDAFHNHPFPPQFVGILTSPGSVQVVIERPPERGPAITPFSREKFVQGAIFDLATGALLDVTNEDYLDIIYDAAPTPFTIDFETEDDFTTPLVNGQDVSTPPEFGALLSISALQPGAGPHHQGPAIFDTDPTGPNAGSSDPDLLVGLGNALMLQENPGQTVPGIFNLPDDAANGGTLVFDFTGFDSIEKVRPLSIDLIDVDSGTGGVKVFLTDILGRGRVFSAPTGWTEDIAAQGPPGFRTLDLTTLDPQPGFASTATATSDSRFLENEVARMEVVMLGSGAVDNLRFSREQDPALVARPRGRTDGPATSRQVK